MPRYGAMADINMTPFIDVMLVLLIIFMVAAPLLTSGVAVDLPQAKAGALNVEQKPVSVTIDDKGQVYLMDEPSPTPISSTNCGASPRTVRMRASTFAPRRPCPMDVSRRSWGGDQRRIQESRARHRTRLAMKRRPA